MATPLTSPPAMNEHCCLLGLLLVLEGEGVRSGGYKLLYNMLGMSSPRTPLSVSNRGLVPSKRPTISFITTP